MTAVREQQAPEPLIQTVLSLYENPSFQVKERGALSQPRSELACCLSHGVQRHGYLFGLELNLEKCEHVAFNSECRVYFRTGKSICQCSCEFCKGHEEPGSLVPSVHEVKYLGARLEDTGGASRFFRR